MTNLNATLHGMMSASDGQVDRKRKVSSTSTSCSSLDSGSNDFDSRECSELRKIARFASHTRHSNVSSSSENPTSSLSKHEDCLSDSDSEDREKCPICLRAFGSQTLSVTDTCNHHTFCLSCLEEWSRTRKTCPVDRIEYKSILVLDSAGNVSRQLPIRSLASSSFATWSPPYEPTLCEVCGLFTNDEVMLICDGCGMGYHIYCLVPPLESMPTGIWLCNDCWYYYNY